MKASTSPVWGRPASLPICVPIRCVSPTRPWRRRAAISASVSANRFSPAKARVFKTKKGAQDAHEAIRPSNPALDPESIRKSLTPDQYKLYKLIWSRFIAYTRSRVCSTRRRLISCAAAVPSAPAGRLSRSRASSRCMKRVRTTRPRRKAARRCPRSKRATAPAHIATEPKQHFTQPPPRYTEASLIKTMEEKGIGRPSTYAPTISVVIGREYVVKEGKALRATALGEAVTDLMIDKFHDIVDVQFTANMEDELDGVESGKVDYRKMLSEFYDGFSAELKQAEIDLDKKRIKVPDEESDVVCELCGRKMVIKSGRFGKFLACPGYPECKNTKPLSEDTGVPCPVCGARLLKKKSKSGFYYYGCEKNPTCPFMTWDKPTQQKCPQCGGTLYRHYTKEEKRMVCHVPGCGYFEELPVRKSAKSKASEADSPAEEKPKRTRRKAAAAAEAEEPAKKTTRRKAAAAAETEEPAKKTTRRKAAAAAETEEPAKKTTRRKTAAAAEAEEPVKKTTRRKAAAAAEAEEPAQKTTRRKKAAESDE